MCALSGRRHRGSRESRGLPLRDARRNPGSHPSTERDSVEELDMRLTYRTVTVLAAIAAQPGLSNSQLGEHAGIADQGQISRLVSRLARLQLIENTREASARAPPSRGGSRDMVRLSIERSGASGYRGGAEASTTASPVVGRSTGRRCRRTAPRPSHRQVAELRVHERRCLSHPAATRLRR